MRSRCRRRKRPPPPPSPSPPPAPPPPPDTPPPSNIPAPLEVPPQQGHYANYGSSYAKADEPRTNHLQDDGDGLGHSRIAAHQEQDANDQRARGEPCTVLPPPGGPGP